VSPDTYTFSNSVHKNSAWPLSIDIGVARRAAVANYGIGVQHSILPEMACLVRGLRPTSQCTAKTHGMAAYGPGRPSLTGHCGHGWTSSLPRPVASDPIRTLRDVRVESEMRSRSDANPPSRSQRASSATAFPKTCLRCCCRRWDEAELLQHRQLVKHQIERDMLAVAKSEYLDIVHL
jgi:hypothetical protein